MLIKCLGVMGCMMVVGGDDLAFVKQIKELIECMQC